MTGTGSLRRGQRTQRGVRGLVGFVALTATLAIVAAGCGGGSGGDTPEGSGPATPKRGGAMTYALEAETTLGWCIPEAQFAISGIQVVNTLYDTLTVPGPKGEAVPWLAESVTPNAAQDEWTIELRPGITFHDGSKLTAAVVKNNIDAWRGAYANRSPLLYLFVLEPVESVDVVDPLTVKVALKHPWPAFAGYLHGNGRLGVMAQAQLDDQETCDRKPIGTGPFMLERESDWRVNDHLTATRNPSWWYAKVSGKPYPYLDEITYKPIIAASDRLRALKTGDVDAGHFSDQQAIIDLRTMADDGSIALDESGDFAEVGYVMLNAAKPPLDDQRVRRALAFALDREEQDQLNGGGIGTPASGPFAKGVMGYLPDTGYPEHDPAEARALLDDYEVDTGDKVRFTITSPADPDNLESAQTLQAAWKEIGVETTIQPVADQSQYINYAIGGEYDAILWRNHPGGDPDGQYVWWHSGSPVNFGRIDDPVIDKDLEAGRIELDAAKRTKIYEDLNREFARQVWNVWSNWAIWAVPYRNGVHAVGGAYGPPEPGSTSAYRGLATGHPVYQFWHE